MCLLLEFSDFGCLSSSVAPVIIFRELLRFALMQIPMMNDICSLDVIIITLFSLFMYVLGGKSHRLNQ